MLQDDTAARLGVFQFVEIGEVTIEQRRVGQRAEVLGWLQLDREQRRRPPRGGMLSVFHALRPLRVVALGDLADPIRRITHTVRAGNVHVWLRLHRLGKGAVDNDGDGNWS